MKDLPLLRPIGNDDEMIAPRPAQETVHAPPPARRARAVIAVLCCVGVFLVGAAAPAVDPAPHVVVFGREGCPDCRRMDEVLDSVVARFPDLVVAHFQESEPGATDLLWTLSGRYGIFPTKFPVIFVGEIVIVGAGRDKELELRSAVTACGLHGCVSPLERAGGRAIPWTTILAIGVAALILLAVLLQ